MTRIRPVARSAEPLNLRFAESPGATLWELGGDRMGAAVCEAPRPIARA